MQEREGQLKQSDVKKLVPFMRKFNAMSKAFLALVNFEIEEKEKRIRVLVTEMGVPNMQTNRISITTVDLGKTKIRVKGGSSSNQLMEWEKQMRKTNKGLLI